MAFVLFSLGSNSDRERRIGAALTALNDAFGTLWLSRIFESRPVGFNSPHNFYNLVAGAHCNMTVAETSAWCKAVERANGRDHSAPKFSARSLDIDILTVDALTGTIDGVTLPRDEIDFNAFVLRPLAESFGERRHPLGGQPYRAMWHAFDADRQALWPVDFEWRGQRLSSATPTAFTTMPATLVR
ncbi:2-amino-4-hydroxy-6-hydroxymethyldihydropteridine diphosphokinase [Kushneria aurantia]|uniref:2-amino-4-hydroxy-6-hydroxymethyldihydropteridine diphosphokinase n=1 Tax=Kushneria aurantia TaxID=504092 RepID=A0ABV6G604_9GAMM|nr:2-amino-4-hydroxy-6-hydroxymethyldihydropteridine diphosphokinase [Kushneria aurantia]